MVRPGNATANDAADLVTVLGTGIDQRPAEVAAGHRVDSDAGGGRRRA